jgi:hypothetical protein
MFCSDEGAYVRFPVEIDPFAYSPGKAPNHRLFGQGHLPVNNSATNKTLFKIFDVLLP